MLHRRKFLGGLISAMAAPVHAGNLMPIKAMDFLTVTEVEYPSAIRAELADITRRAYMPRLYVQLYRSIPLLTEMDTA